MPMRLTLVQKNYVRGARSMDRVFCVILAAVAIQCRSKAPSTARAAPSDHGLLIAEPSGGPWVNCTWVEVSRGGFVGGCIVKAPYIKFLCPSPFPQPMNAVICTVLALS